MGLLKIHSMVGVNSLIWSTLNYQVEDGTWVVFSEIIHEWYFCNKCTWNYLKKAGGLIHSMHHFGWYLHHKNTMFSRDGTWKIKLFGIDHVKKYHLSGIFQIIRKYAWKNLTKTLLIYWEARCIAPKRSYATLASITQYAKNIVSNVLHDYIQSDRIKVT